MLLPDAGVYITSTGDTVAAITPLNGRPNGDTGWADAVAATIIKRGNIHR
jgi:antitoxin (DNA-binding transcriptional repressor) of toxin-antitoxin stability system